MSKFDIEKLASFFKVLNKIDKKAQLIHKEELK